MSAERIHHEDEGSPRVRPRMANPTVTNAAIAREAADEERQQATVWRIRSARPA